MRRTRVGTLLFASAAYVIIGTATAALAGIASSPAGVKAWRLAAWLLSLGVFATHIVSERRRQLPPVSVATSVALAVALGAFVVAALGPFRAHLGDPSRLKLALLSLIAWPLLTGIPAFVVALLVTLGLEHSTAIGRTSGTTSSDS